MKLRQAFGLSVALVIMSSAALAKQSQSSHHQPVASKSKAAKHVAASTSTTKRQRTSGRIALTREQESQAAGPDTYVGMIQITGRREIGAAAWYGGHHLGRRTASGEPLDAVHATAAHRSLPLHSLVRVTNLSNGRSVIARITDRGPVSRSLLIDVSPRAAEQLDMIRSGVATVAVDPVTPVLAQAR